MIIRAPVIVTMNGAPVIEGAVRIEGNRIAQVGRLSEFSTLTAAEENIQLTDCVLLPGLINTHGHLDYTGLRGKIAPRDSFTDWIRAINAEKAKLSETDYLQSISDGSLEALRCGTTSIVNLEAFPQIVARCLPGPLRIWWCAELIDVTSPKGAGEIVAAAINHLGTGNPGSGVGLAPHALYTASTELYRRCQRVASEKRLVLTTHLGESREEMEMFRDAAGPLFEFLRSLGRSESDCGRTTPLETFLQITGGSATGLRSAQNDRNEDSARWIVAHLNELTERDFDLLESLPGKFSIAHCPRSHLYFQHSPFAFERLRDLGFNICLATDSLASNTDLSLFAEMREFRNSHDKILADELLQMVTVNPAKALGCGVELGRIAPGYLADIIALPLHGSGDVYDQTIAFEGDTPWVMIGGEIL